MTSAQPAALNLANIQGDVLAGLAKNTETYVFFQIDNARKTEFRKALNKLIPLITTTTQAQGHKHMIAAAKQSAAQHKVQAPVLTVSSVNISFSHTGLAKLGLTDKIDPAFDNGMLADAENLGDKGSTTDGKFSPDWNPAFKSGHIDGMLIFAADCHATNEASIKKVEALFSVGAHDSSLHEILRIVGDVRPGKERGHEHFGFKDGISNPAVKDVDTKPFPGQETIPQGITLLGRDGDVPNTGSTRPAWALDGSFAAFRYLFQLVPEFDEFLRVNPIPGLPPSEGSEFFGARLVGRWKSGAPLDLAPVKDDPAIGADPQRNNDFRYDFKNPDDFQSQDRCPFAAHLRKTNPRNDLEQPFGPDATTNRRIIRRGIQFGPEVTAEEKKQKKTIKGRGLIFVAYQSNIVNGFQFIQHSWANNTAFPPNKVNAAGATVNAGFDPIIGQQTSGGPRTAGGIEPQDADASTKLPTEWVVPKGGEYFFTPSISALKSSFALPAGK